MGSVATLTTSVVTWMMIVQLRLGPGDGGHKPMQAVVQASSVG